MSTQTHLSFSFLFDIFLFLIIDLQEKKKGIFKYRAQNFLNRNHIINLTQSLNGVRRKQERLGLHACLVAQACLTLCHPMDYSLPGSSAHGNFQLRILEWVAITYSRRIFLIQRSNLHLLHCRRILHLVSHWRSLVFNGIRRKQGCPGLDADKHTAFDPSCPCFRNSRFNL